mmetsp:Transcript_26419/g.67908  ORF Transcript_26419/g.67908 Transcript_26419/m.67908 type:complete len:201 (+) Transcript_26419:1511-2113(+)
MISRPPGCRRRPAPASSPSVAENGAMCVIFTQSTPTHDAASKGHSLAGVEASSSTGGRTLGTLLLHAATLPKSSSSTLVGCHSRSGSFCAKKAACWPVPAATSTSVPRLPPSQWQSTSAIGSLLRSAASAKRAPGGIAIVLIATTACRRAGAARPRPARAATRRAADGRCSSGRAGGMWRQWSRLRSQDVLFGRLSNGSA